MKQGILLAALICVAVLAKAQTPTPREAATRGPSEVLAQRLTPTAPAAATPTPPPGLVETYKVVNGMSIRASVYNVNDGRTHRVAIVIHGGGYSGGGMETSVAQELSQYGFMGVAIEYRLAPPHAEMNTPAHPFPGQNDIGDDGHYPEQTDDVRDAIVYYRNDPRSNGEVVLIGGSAGASHSLYLAATGTPGYDMPDLAVMLSCAASNLTDPNGWALECIGGEACPHNAVANYLNIPDPAPNPPVGNDLVLAQEASSTNWMHTGMCPFWSMCSSRDSLGIPTSTGYNIRSYLPNNTPGVLENGENGIVPRALGIGLTESSSSEPEAGSFKTTIVPVSVWSHSFDYWNQVKSDVIHWIGAPIPSGGVTPTPTPTPAPAMAVVADFNSDGHQDWVVRNVNTGQTVLLYLNDNAVVGAAVAPTLTANLALIGAADFNLDMHPDFALLSTKTFQTTLWYLSGGSLIGTASGPALPAGWELIATADFNGDNNPDFVIFNTSTQLSVIVYLNNNVVVGAAILPTLPAGWNLAGVADFNGDGQMDIVVFIPSTGQTLIGYLSGATLIGAALGPTLPMNWQLVAAADFNGDGRPDYLIYNPATGQTAIWHLNDNAFINAVSGVTLPSGWTLLSH